MHHVYNEKRETTHDKRDRITKPRKNQNAQRKRNLRILEVNIIKLVEMKLKKRVSQVTNETTGTPNILLKYHQSDKRLKWTREWYLNWMTEELQQMGQRTKN